MGGAEAVAGALLGAVAPALMGGMKKKPQEAAAPTPSKPTPMPVEDDEAARRAKIREQSRLTTLSGRESTLLTGARGDSSQAATRQTLG